MEVDDCNDSDEDNAIANQLLKMGQPANASRTANDGEGESLDQDNETSVSDRTPILQVYEPKVLKIFKAFNDAVSPNRVIDCTGHMMITCLVHIVSFCSWARSSEATLNWITTEINENMDLRPRVRNGLTLLFVYAVASAKSNMIGGTDMFSVMQDSDTGLGIVNRTSLKIYNDNFSYFTFLKSCLSGLIVAGLVPENERSNQPKRPKKLSDNGEEIAAFHEMQTNLIQLLLNGQIGIIKIKLKEILSIWHDGNKTWKSSRFSAAAKILSGIQLLERPPLFNIVSSTVDSSLLPAWSAQTDSEDPMVSAPVPNVLSAHLGARLSNFANFMENPKPAKLARVETSSSASDFAILQADSKPSGGIGNSKPSSAFDAVLLIRCSRWSQRSWMITQTKIFDMGVYLQTCKSPIYLVDYSLLFPTESDGFISSSDVSAITLEKTLLSKGALVASWSVTDFPQLMSLYDRAKKESSLLKAWKRGTKDFTGATNNQSADETAINEAGALIVDQSISVLLFVRSCQVLGVTEPCWRQVYCNDLIAMNSASFAEFISGMFPQYRIAFNRSKASVDQSDVIIRYFSHDCNGMAADEYVVSHAHRNSATQSFQTVGVLSDPAEKILSNFASSTQPRTAASLAVCHELFFDCL